MKHNKRVTYTTVFGRIAEYLAVTAGTCVAIASYIVIEAPELEITGYINLAGLTGLALSIAFMFVHAKVNDGVQVASYVDEHGIEMTHTYRTR